MSTQTRRPLAEAEKAADDIISILFESCERIEVAGSIRRKQAYVGDIEIVAIPKTVMRQRAGQLTFFQPAKSVKINAVWERITDSRQFQPVKRPTNKHELIADDENWINKGVAGKAKYFKVLDHESRFMVDLFLTTPEAWGAIFTIRTGCAGFSKALVTYWTRISRGGHMRDGLFHDAKGNVVPTPEEEDVFRIMELPFISPEERVDGRVLHRGGGK